MSWLPSCSSSPAGLIGVTLNIDEEDLGVVVLGEASHIQEGSRSSRPGTVLSVPVGDALLGRVIDPLGNPVDGKGPIDITERRLLETRRPRWWSGSRSRSRCRPGSRPSTR